MLKIVPLDAVLAKLGIAKPQLVFSQVTHLLTPIAVRRSAANYKMVWHASALKDSSEVYDFVGRFAISFSG